VSHPAAVRVEGLRYSYAPAPKRGAAPAVADVLQGLSFSASAGRITGLLGPNGSGKSTTFKILSTQLRPAAGDAWILGRSVVTEEAAARALLGVTFQAPSLDPWLSVRENLEIHAALYGVANAGARIEEALDALSVRDRAGERVKTLSGGLARRAELAKTLLARPQVLLLDEPTTGLDPRARLEFWRELRRLRDAGISLLVTTHLMDEAELCDELLFLDAGRLVAQGTPAELKAGLGTETLTARGPGLRSHEAALQRELGPGVELEWGQATLADVYLSKTGKTL
jgi:ABC-2 type transport system ATP-binding protein